MTRAKQSRDYSHAFRILITPEIRSRLEKSLVNSPSLVKNDMLSVRLRRLSCISAAGYGS